MTRSLESSSVESFDKDTGVRTWTRMAARNQHDAQPAADGAANHSECADAFTGHPPTVDEIQYRAYKIHLDHGGLYGYDLDDWLHAERELTEAHRLRASTKDKNP